MNANGKLALGWLIVLALAQPAAASTFSFVPGHYYVNRYSSTGIHQYDESGNQVGFLSDPAQRTRSIAFGPDNLMYVFSEYWPSNKPGDYTAEVRAYNAAQDLEQVYPVTTAPESTDIIFDRAGHFYFGKLKFDIGVADSGQVFFTGGKVPFQTLPGGSFLAWDKKGVYELTPTGAIAREVFRVRGYHDELASAAYDLRTGSLFVSGRMNNDGGVGIWKIDAETSAILGKAHYTEVGDLSITGDGLLLASGGPGAKPYLYAQDLTMVTKFDQMHSAVFVTQYVPEPSTFLLLASAGIVLLAVAAKRRH